MFLGACIDLGLDRDLLTRSLMTVAPGGSLAITRSQRGGLSGVRAEVIVPHEHHHRHLQTILALIQQAELPDPVKQLAGTIFTNLATAEAQVHGIPVEEVHFHEVGALDAIIDICGAAWAVWQLGITQVTASPVATGSGWITCQHGRLPVPAPAVAELLRTHGVPIQPSAVKGELTTPTGAAILVTLVNRFAPSPLTRIDRIGYGLGQREWPGHPNVLRILAQEEESAPSEWIREPVVVLSTHLDDMNPEWYGPLWNRLREAGALDVALLPMTMKKGRPGVRLEVVAHPEQETTLARMILSHTTALGVRLDRMERLILPRTQKKVTTPWGVIRAKEAGGVWRLEHDDLEQLARNQSWSLLQAQQQVAPFLSAAIGESLPPSAEVARHHVS